MKKKKRRKKKEKGGRHQTPSMPKGIENSRKRNIFNQQIQFQSVYYTKHMAQNFQIFDASFSEMR